MPAARHPFMDPSKYANMGHIRTQEESAPLLDLEQQQPSRLSEDTDPFIDDPLASGNTSISKEDTSASGHPDFHTPPTAPSQMTYVDRAGEYPATVASHGDDHAGSSNVAVAGLPPPVTAPLGPSGLATHCLCLIPRVILSLAWFAVLCTWGAMTIVYLIWWMLLQAVTGFTRAHLDKHMVRRDLGGLFNVLLDLFEEIW